MRVFRRFRGKVGVRVGMDFVGIFRFIELLVLELDLVFVLRVDLFLYRFLRFCLNEFRLEELLGKFFETVVK